VDLGAWEKSVLRESRTAATLDDRTDLVVDGLAFQAKCRELVDRVDRAPLPDPEQRLQLVETMVSDAAVGLALQQQLQHEVNDLIRVGRTAEAKTLTAFRNRIVRTSSRLAEILKGDLARQAAELAEQMTPEPRIRPRPDCAPAAEAPAGAPRAVKRPARAQPPAGPAPRSLPLRWLLPLLAVLAGVALWLNADVVLRPPAVAALTVADFAAVEGVQAVTARPPGLYVTLDDVGWDGLGEAEQRRRIEALARIGEPVGYRALHVRASSGRAIGRWDERSGAQLIRRPAGAS
jgi:hypothetical protein